MSFFTDDPNILRSIITDNYQNPRNRKEISDPSFITIHMDSASCIDDIYIQVKIVNNIIDSIFFHGEGCAISIASTSIMTQLVKGKTIEEALKIKEQIDNMLANKEYNQDLIEDAICFKNVNKQPSRITCCNISWRGLEKAILKNKDDEK